MFLWINIELSDDFEEKLTDVSQSVLPRNLRFLRNQLIKSWAESEGTPWKLIKILGLFSPDPVKNPSPSS